MAKALLTDYQWFQWQPNPGVFDGPAGEGETLKSAVIDPVAQRALVYFANNSAVRVRNPLSVPAMTRWFDPRNGNYASAGIVGASEVRELRPPERWEDAVLIIERAR